MIRKITAFAAGVAAGVLALSASAPAAHTAVRQSGLPATDQITNAMIKSGREVFHGQGNCFVCHGQDLEGTPIAPTLQDHKWKDAKDGSLQEIYRVVTHGVDGTAMVSHPGGITDAQAVSAAIYVYSVSHGKTKP
jgi:cytochrome c oxidase cbb3-type subunit 3